jgi:hypothetical protein
MPPAREEAASIQSKAEARLTIGITMTTAATTNIASLIGFKGIENIKSIFLTFLLKFIIDLWDMHVHILFSYASGQNKILSITMFLCLLT